MLASRTAYATFASAGNKPSYFSAASFVPRSAHRVWALTGVRGARYPSRSTMPIESVLFEFFTLTDYAARIRTLLPECETYN